MTTNLTIGIPRWLDKIFAWPLLFYRQLKYGYPFRKIPLGDSFFAIVDPHDFYWLNKSHWSPRKNRGGVYAVRLVNDPDKNIKIYSMHRVIMNPPRDLLVDHRNCDSLDNRRANLRLATHAQNSYNKQKTKAKTSSRFIGVSLDKSRGLWAPRISYQGKKIYLGRFTNEIEAARAYDEAAKQYHGEFAKLNFSEEIERSPKRLNLRLANWLGARLNFTEVATSPERGRRTRLNFNE